MKPRKSNLNWMREVLADLEASQADPRIAKLMAGLTQPSPSIAADVEPDSEILGSPGSGASARTRRRTKR